MKQVQRQQLQQKLSPQQLQLMRLLQMPVTDLERAIKEELEKNPLLEAEAPANEEALNLQEAAVDSSDWDADDDDSLFDYRARQENDPNVVHREFVVTDTLSFNERLMAQLVSRPMTERQRLIAEEIIGSLDDAGYLSRDIVLIANDMAFLRGIEVSPVEVEEVLRTVQSLDPAGIGARNLQECLLLQLERKKDYSERPEHSEYPDESPLAVATAIVRDHFDDFANHRYDRLQEALHVDREMLDQASAIIRQLDPKPASSEADSESQSAAIIPDIVLVRQDDDLQFFVNDGNLPRLSLNTYYTDMLHELEQHKGDKETLRFLQTKTADAQGFITLLQQRHETIVRVMRYIVKHQRQFLLTGDPDKMQPLRQREVAEATGLDISTVSRMANSKNLQTPFGTIPLKDCFSKGMENDAGEEVSVEIVKQRLADAIHAEDKQAPLSDEALTKLLNSQGLPLARRTVAKYREQLGFPVARLRRLIIVLMLLSAFQTHAQMSYYDSIINARIEAGAKKASVPDKKAMKAKTEFTKTPKQAPKETPPVPTPRPPLSSCMVPMWYDAFPQNRVNPLGRATLEMLPDEINIKLMQDSTDFCFPVVNAKTSTYGWRWNRGHHGVDIRLNTGDPVRCVFGGIVRVAARMGGYGNCVVVRHPNGLETLYGHLSKLEVKPHQEVHAGDVIGLGGSTGNSTGPHLHFEVRFMYQTFDPEWILDFNNFSLRTRRLHLDKSYFGIRKPRHGETLEYKADKSIIKDSPKLRRQQPSKLNFKDF